MQILAIETSCDETSAAVVKDGREVLSNIVSTQIEFHKKYGGIVPEIAARKHIEVINPIIAEALDKAKTTFKKIDAVAVTYGPGLVGSLLIGLCAAKAIAYAADKPLIGINHLEGHIYANFLVQAPKFPFICLMVSGGHTMIVCVKDHGKYEIIGRTRDDAVGEAFDKVARFLGLGYPGGPIIDKLSKEGNPKAIEFTRPMLDDGFDFSFSGIKTAVVNYVNRNRTSKRPIVTENVADIAASFQQACVDVLVTKTLRAAQKKKVKTIALAGGVAANSLLRREFLAIPSHSLSSLLIPSLDLCTDNAAMIGAAAYYKFKKKQFADLDLKPVANLSL
ncbi:tRNA (adenosine(37)-N6)-threonylcarbamoyltransferase complex transferase subunit TsaD [candidate division WOR-1 bacterium RIFOXYA12_FULL_43_27]|uniref:tRNA N6-adenosine threonylcarbamoyltransferase n=1 Tax=candidate division WOR-1 bacterium RIFOXYC2_FULL_46_14 TaxID=1802587 RepID=A0A1F4U824_UNCSA|nr:MAG: tRNA (adenosine(37)-N6)-threonylcarbamoyltransferase complex transferase subunit TsaD [candidate division WOR-1 bacterium RIFOXYA12_FULL_43_27]OGC19448.1 MAG: tRNA (adenosine(37)-N6)-threonylcarbamoyltransferase complex transferase subunit TsaD [candidate division WOR-1 bacterium RIFOXYB2_FULL_46_45]OGC30437.1 MAG: tRNA (adenosine(37)-N6)-threonylcarbamoyltransferase complex transferase subunit TsaD [candidate division WOR-1 bacterium RIFOXYA2_FULL_46_56]OGC41037.1 MAG: tRNA (adenosine(3